MLAINQKEQEQLLKYTIMFNYLQCSMETTLSQHFAKEIASRISLCRNLCRNSINVACEGTLLFVLPSNETVYFLNFTLT